MTGMAPNLAAPPADPDTSREAHSPPPTPRSRGPLVVVIAAGAVTLVAVAWLLVAGSLAPGDTDAVSSGAADPIVSESVQPDPASNPDVLADAEGDAEPNAAPVETSVGTVPEALGGRADDDAGESGSVEPDSDGLGSVDQDLVDVDVDVDVDGPGVPALVLQPQSRAVFRDGQVILFGAVPSREVADEIFDLAASVLGPENVVDNYDIDPSVPAPTTGNLTVEETIEFGSGTAVLPDPVPVILPVGVALMTAQPTAELRLIGHTDGRGSEAANLELSIARAEAVKAYFVENGIDPARIEVTGMGESQPVASDDTDAGRRENRRIEFEVSNILGEG